MDSWSKKNSNCTCFFFSSILVFLFYLFFFNFDLLTPYSLKKSRYLLNQDEYNSILPTLKTQEFNDTFKGLIFFVENNNNNQLENVFLQDKGNHFKNLSSDISKNTTTNIIAQKGFVDNKKIILLNGQIISSKKNLDDEIIKFDQLNINLDNVNTNTIKGLKIQETSTLKLISCLTNVNLSSPNCAAKDEIVSSLNRRIVLPFYIPVISLIVSLLLISAKRIYFNRNLIFTYSFILLIFIELLVRYTGINNYIFYIFLISPLILLILVYFILFNKFTNETV